jgi:hypothetical protein
MALTGQELEDAKAEARKICTQYLNVGRSTKLYDELSHKLDAACAKAGLDRQAVMKEEMDRIRMDRTRKP